MGPWGGRFVGAGMIATVVTACVDKPDRVGVTRPEASVSGVSDRPADGPQNVVLVTLDGVRWQEIFGGVDARLAERAHMPRGAIAKPSELTPNIDRLFFAGGTVLGDPKRSGGIEASGPNHVSMPGYLEIVTGALTPCRANDCGIAPSSTLLDEMALQPGARPSDIAAFTSWEELGKIAARDPSRVVVRAGRGDGDQVPAYPGNQRYRPDRATAILAIDHLLAAKPRFLWISLGDTDEWAHRRDYRGYLGALREADAFLGELTAHLDEMGSWGARTALFVTTDHGRDEGFADHGGPASARVWLLARGASIPRRGAVGTRDTRHLRDITPTLRVLLGLPARTCDLCGAPIEEVLPAAGAGPSAAF